jgi:hypothetical protein
MLRGVRGAKPVDRAALADMIERVSRWSADFPEIAEMDLNPVFATKTNGATAADVRIVLDFNPARRAIGRARTRSSRDEPHHEAQSGRGDRRVGRERQDRQLRDEEPHQRRLQGEIYPIHPKAEDHGQEGLQERQGRAGRSTSRCSRFRRNSWPGAEGMRREENRRRHSDSVGLRRDRQCEGPEEIVAIGRSTACA